MKITFFRMTLLTAILLGWGSAVWAQTPVVTPLPDGVFSLSGKILEKGNKNPVLGGSVFLEAVANTVEAQAVSTAPLSADADMKGSFQLGVPAGTYKLIVAGEGFKKLTLVSFTINKNVEKSFFLERDGFTLPEVIVSTDKVPPTQVSHESMTKEELHGGARNPRGRAQGPGGAAGRDNRRVAQRPAFGAGKRTERQPILCG